MKFDPLNDGISYVELMEAMGDDLMVVNAARVSMYKESYWEYPKLPVGHPENPYTFEIAGTAQLSEADTKLISYLAKHKHWTPFSHPQVQLRIKMPIFIARQWFKHQVGFTRNEVSRRYVDDTPELFIPTKWRKRAPNVKQGSSDEEFSLGPVQSLIEYDLNKILDLYSDLLKNGVCPEQARMVLPQNMYTEFYETASLAAYARLCGLRLDPHAQKEVRMYAEAVSKILEQLFSVSWKALSNG